MVTGQKESKGFKRWLTYWPGMHSSAFLVTFAGLCELDPPHPHIDTLSEIA